MGGALSLCSSELLVNLNLIPLYPRAGSPRAQAVLFWAEIKRLSILTWCVKGREGLGEAFAIYFHAFHGFIYYQHHVPRVRFL